MLGYQGQDSNPGLVCLILPVIFEQPPKKDPQCYIEIGKDGPIARLDIIS